MTDVAIVGIGLHPFGRFDGITGLEMGAYAVRQALRDAGIEWKDIGTAFGGSWHAGFADSLVNLLGLTGVQFTHVYNGCATAGTAVAMAARAISSGAVDTAVACGFDKHPRGAFAADPGLLGIGSWYAETGMMNTTQFFAMKINRYMHEFGITQETLAKVANKNYRNAAINPNAWRRKPWSVEEILEAPMLNYPLTHYMFCSPDEGGVAVVLCRADQAKRYTDTPIYLRAAEVRTRRFGAFEVFSTWLPIERTESPTVDAAKATFEAAGISPSDVDVAQVQDSEAGAEIMHMAENGFCADGEQEALIQAGETEIGGRLPVNTDGGLIGNGEPIGASGLRQIYEVCLQLRGDAGERQVPGNPKVGYTQVYGAPGTGACTLLTT
ncbi:MAG TPA: thiolase family protein [Actinomycetota bacterium]|jgi:acetyl-CoA acetyltransferase|nr:thiolase family protein [Actinomycetota bacterium]